MANIEVKSKDGKKVGSHAVSEVITSAKPAATVLHRTVVAEEANKRQGTQSAKTRSEVKGGGRKPYKQKKTGNARQGSTRSPQYTHGGMALAVKPRDYDKKVNKKERRSAILGALNLKLEAGDLFVADAIQFATPKTSDALAMLKAFGLDEVRRVLVVLTTYDETTFRSFRNLKNVEVRTAPAGKGDTDSKTVAFSARDLVVAHKILIAKDALAKIEEVWAK